MKRLIQFEIETAEDPRTVAWNLQVMLEEEGYKPLGKIEVLYGRK